MSREIIADANAYFARQTVGCPLGIRIDRVAKHPRLEGTYYIHVCGGVAYDELRHDVSLLGVARPGDYNNVMCGECGSGWSIFFEPRAV